MVRALLVVDVRNSVFRAGNPADERRLAALPAIHDEVERAPAAGDMEEILGTTIERIPS